MIHQAVFDGLFGVQVEIPFGILLDDIHRFSGMLRHNVIQEVAQTQDLLGLDLDISGLTLRAAQRLVQVNGCIWQGVPAAFRTCG